MAKVQLTKIALIQMRCGPEPEENFKRAIQFIRDAAKQGAQIVCLPELFRSQYFCQTEDHKNFDLAEEVPGRSTSVLGDVARELGIVIIASLFEKRSAGVYHNTAAIIDTDGKLLGKYRKMHIPDDPLYHEKFYFTPGDLGFQAWITAQGKIGVCVCWDQWYPEAARLTALRGAEILFYPTAIGWHPSEKKQFGAAQYSAWETIQRSHAIANGCYVAAANRIGHEVPPLAASGGSGGIEFWGQSFLAAPSGEIIAKGSVDREEIVIADVEWDRVNEHRTHWPFLRDRRVDAYAGLEKRMID
jgi:N-carbamoylputrescine amidase